MFKRQCRKGMSLVALHNRGGVGIGKAINGGFGLVLDGSEKTDDIIKSALLWDVMCCKAGLGRNKTLSRQIGIQSKI